MKPDRLILACDCFGSVSRVLPREALTSAITARFPGTGVVFFSGLCRPDDLAQAAAAIAQDQPGRVVVAACSAFAKGKDVTGGLTARGAACRLALADVREGVAFVHKKLPGPALDKALDLIGMALEEAAGPRPEPYRRSPPGQSVLVVGAGPAGLAAASVLARLGVNVTLAETQAKPGGLVARLGKLFPDNISGGDFLAPLLAGIDSPRVRLLTGAQVTQVKGVPGDFTASVKTGGAEEEVRAGAVILACGAVPVLPGEAYRAKEVSGVVSQMELETRLAKWEAAPESAEAPARVVLIQCLKARDEANPYCSTICCPTAVKNALRLRSLRPDCQVTLCHRGIMTPGKDLEDLYRRAMAAGVRLVAFDAARPPRVLGEGKVDAVLVHNALSGQEETLAAAMVVTSTPLKPWPALAGLAASLGLRLDELGFACGVEPMRPLCPPLPGIYLCGTARWPVYAAQAADQGYAAGAMAAAFLSGPAQTVFPASIDAGKCARCGRCQAACPYAACARGQDGTFYVTTERCQACGCCAAVCPSGAARLTGSDPATLRAMLRQAASGRRAAWA